MDGLRETVGFSLPGVDRDGEGQAGNLAQGWNSSQVSCCCRCSFWMKVSFQGELPICSGFPLYPYKDSRD